MKKIHLSPEHDPTEGRTLHEAATAVLKAMTKQAMPGTDGSMIWRGSLVTLISKHVAVSRYSQIRRLLIDSGAAVQLSRGGGRGGTSQWQIVNPNANMKGVKLTKGSASRRDTLERRVNDLERFTKDGLAELARKVEQLEIIQADTDEDSSL